MPIVASISQQIWDMKYRLRGPANGPIAGEAGHNRFAHGSRRSRSHVCLNQQVQHLMQHGLR